MAIGANRRAVSLMVLRQGIVLAVVGLVLGLAGSVGAGELFPSGVPNRREPERSRRALRHD